MHNQPVAIVTGAGSGIGRETARLLAEAGHALALVGRRLEALEETAAMLREGATSVGIAIDITDPGASAEIVDSTLERFGRVDVLVNNAGDAPLVPIAETTPELLQRVFAVNAIAPGALIAAAWPTLVHQGRGCIVNVSTMGTADPFPGYFAYAAAKASVNLFARSCANEGRSHGIRAFAVAPGAVETAMLRRNFPESVIPASECLSPADVARVIVDCVAGRHDRRTGDTLFVTAQSGVR